MRITPIIQSTLYVSKDYPNWKTVNKTVAELNDGLKEICFEMGVIFLDINAVLSEGSSMKTENVHDGIHLTGLAYKEWGKILLGIIENFKKRTT